MNTQRLGENQCADPEIHWQRGAGFRLSRASARSAGMTFDLTNAHLIIVTYDGVLAIGLVVDDAIVVVEAVEHHIEQGMSPRDATVQAMKEVSGPVIAIALILSPVFLPVAFMAGIQGRLKSAHVQHGVPQSVYLRDRHLGSVTPGD